MKPKICIVCKLEVPPLEYYGNKSAHEKCRTEKEAAYRAENYPELFKRQADWRAANRDKANATQRTWYAARKIKKVAEAEAARFAAIEEFRVKFKPPKQKNPRIPKKEKLMGVGSVWVKRTDHKREEFRARIREQVMIWEEKKKEKMV